MGDRGNIVIRGETQNGRRPADIYLYTHWQGNAVPHIVQRGLQRILAAGRADDYPYAARLLFQEMTHRHEHDDTGFALSTYLTDYDHAALVVDFERQEVTWRRIDWETGKLVGPLLFPHSFTAYCTQPAAALDAWQAKADARQYRIAVD